MASSPGNTNPQTPPFDLHSFFKPSANSYLAPAASYPPHAGPFLHDQHHQNLYMPSPVAFAGAQPPQSPQAHLQQQRSLPYPTPPPNLPSPRGNHNAGTHILALLTNNNAGGSGNAVNSQDLPHQQPPHEMLRSFPGGSGPIRVPSGKLPTGRRLVGDHVEYDVDKRIPGEVQPQLEVTPITKYGSDPQLVVGRQIAVNKFYICYGLKGGNVRVLNINTALRSLFRGHNQRVSDMAFFAEDIHLLASVSIEGRVFAWKISEGSEGEDQPQITGGIVLAVHILGEGDAKHPRICWHCHKQEILIVSIGKSVLRIDTNKVGKGEVYSAEAPLECPLEKLIDGIQLFGKHDGEVTDLSMCQWLTTRLVSSSLDGTIKIWDDRKAQPLAVLRPHDGHPVQSATFLTAPVRPDHTILITGGSLNRELKIWVLESEEGWLLPSDAESWKCTQTLDLKSSSEQAEEAFFNQIVALSQAGLLLLANAKRNAIYVVHLDYALCPVQTRMDYLTEFTVTIPILSFTGTNDHPDEHVVRVYCVQTQAIQQYTLDLCQCLPPPLENMGIEKSDSDVSREVTSSEGCSAPYPYGAITTELPLAVSAPKLSVIVSGSERTNAMRYPANSGSIEDTSLEGTILNDESRTSALASASCDAHTVCAPPPVPLSPSLSSKHSDYPVPTEISVTASPHGNHSGMQPVTNYSVDGQIDTIETKISDVPSLDGSSRSGELKLASDDSDAMQNSPMLFKRPTHLVTPSEILMMAVTSADPTSATKGKNTMDAASIQDTVVNTDVKRTELDGKEVCRSSSSQIAGTGNSKEPQNQVSQSREKIFYSQASEESYVAEESGSPDQSSQGEEGEGLKSRGVPAKFTESVSQGTSTAAPTKKGKKERSKSSQGLTSLSSSTINLADSSNEQGHSTILPPPEPTQFLAIQETLNQLLMSQKEMQKQLSSIVNAPVKEGKRLEVALGRTIEKVSKASTDALWAQVHDELVRSEKSSRDQSQETINVMTNYMNKELNASFERVAKKELAAIGPAVVRAITPAIEKTVTSTIADSFQKGVGDKTVNQLEKTVGTKLEATVARQIQAQFQTTGRQALQEALKSALEASLIPAFEVSCKTMFEQIVATFQKGISEHTITAQQHFESAHSRLALALRDAINSASSVAHTLSQELAEGQRKMLALAAPSAASGATNLLITQTSGGPLGGLHEKFEAPLDPTKELSRLIFEGKYEEAFTSALQRSDVSIVSWLCSQVDLHRILGMVPLPLSQGVLLSLLQQLACDLGNDVQRKLAWMTDVSAAINPADHMIAVHARPVLEQVYQILHHQRGSSPGTGDLSSIRLLMHVINSMLMSCK